MSIDVTLHNELSSLYNECIKLIDELEKNYAQRLISWDYINSNNNERTNIIELLKQITSQLEIHLKLDDTTITTVDFYTNFQMQFETGRYKKGVDYYIQEGYGGTESLVTDPETLRREFSINNCMNSMNLVPINLASNAMKYMLGDQHVKVVLLKTHRRNIITITNLGPKNQEDNLEKLTEEGYRGNNSSNMAGMGLGLAQIKSIIGLHKTLLDASIDLAQGKDTLAVIGDKEYTSFSVTITYLRSSEEQANTPAMTEFKNRIPLIIAHNMVDILANLFVVTDRLPKLRLKEYDKVIKNNYDKIINKFQLDLEKMQETIKLCLYVRNQYQTTNLLGNICPIAIATFFKREIEHLIIHKYSHIPKPIIRGGSRNISTYSAIYPALYGICGLILENSDRDTELDIEIDNTGITITSDSIDFCTILYYGDLKDSEHEQIQHIRSCMCIDILEDSGINVEINNNELKLNYKDVENE